MPDAKREPRAPSTADQKLQRWIDLLAALLNRRYGATFAQLREVVPAYAGSTADAASLERMFERDKDELRAFGVPIDVERGSDGEPDKYLLDRREMYLPYLALTATASAERRERAGYRDLPTLVLEPDELTAVLSAATLARQLGDPALAGDIDNALRKLTFDLAPVSDTAADSALSPHRDPVHVAATLRALGAALLRRKRVSFLYHSITGGDTSRRDVEPWGLFFTSGHWYLAARDVSKGDVRNFRVSRMAEVAMNKAKPQSTDYDIPATFRLAEHARSRAAWELGDEEGEEMVLEFRITTGATLAAAQLGRPLAGHEHRRAFHVRRLDTFARWVLSFSGEVVPVSPPRLVDAWRALARDTLAIYATERA